MPWNDPTLAPCYDPASDFEGCPVDGSCVGCEARAYDYNSCGSEFPTDPHCPPSKPTLDCQPLWDFYNWQYQLSKEVFPTLPVYEPKTPLNSYLRYGIWRNEGSLFLTLSQVTHFGYYDEYNPDPEPYALPEEGLSLYLHLGCEGPAGELSLTVEEIKVKQKQLVPPEIAYALKLRTAGEVPYGSELTVDPIRLGANAYSHTLRLERLGGNSMPLLMEASYSIAGTL